MKKQNYMKATQSRVALHGVVRRAGSRVSKTERDIYLRHIIRLKDERDTLASMLVEERRMRKRAYAWYQERLRSRVWMWIDIMLMRHH